MKEIENTLNVLARFVPRTDDKFEANTVAAVFSKTIQMDNTLFVIQLQIDNSGYCTHYTKGDTITGVVCDKNINTWDFSSTWGDGFATPSCTTNTPALPGNIFSIFTPIDDHPCGSISLSGLDKTIVDSISEEHHEYASYNICLKEKK